MGKLKFYFGVVLLTLLSNCEQKDKHNEDILINSSIEKCLDLAQDERKPLIERIKCNDKAYSLIKENFNRTSINSFYRATANFYNFNKLKDLKSSSKLFFNKAQLSKDKYWIARSYKMTGLFYMNNSENEKALYYFLKSKKIFLSLKQYRELLNTLSFISLTQNYAGDFLGSNKTAFQILKVKNEFGINIADQNVYIQIGNNLSSLKQDDKAIQYYLKAFKMDIDLESRIILVNNISSSYIELREYRKAYKELDSILKIEKLKALMPSNYATALSLFGYCKLKLDKLEGLPEIFLKAEKIYQNNHSVSGRNYNLVYLSKYYERINEIDSAIIHAQRAVNLSKTYKNPIDILFSLKQLVKVDKFNASERAQEYIYLNDSLQIAERRFRDKFAQFSYETDVIKQEKENAIRQNWIISCIAATIVIIIVLLLIITRQRLKQKELKSLQLQQQANEEIYNLMLEQKSREDLAKKNEKRRIAIELHDGVMNRLSSTRLNLDILNHKRDESTVKKCLKYIAQIYQIEQEIRNIAHDLSLEQFKSNNSFVTLVNDFVNTQKEISKTYYRLEMDSLIKWDCISSNIKMNLFRIMQEATQNINKFAEAKFATISFIVDDFNICLSITDNGKGFDSEIKSEGIGLRNIKERVEIMKGKLTIQSVNKNTSLNIAIPFSYIEQNIAR